MKRALIALLLATMMVVSFVSPVMAINPPDTPPAVNAVYVYNLADGGVGVLIDYYLDYATLPYDGNVTATESYMAVFIDTDGTTQLKTVAPYTFVDSGYRRGLIWIRFTAAEVATYSLDAADIALYRIWLVGNPTLAWAGGIPPKTIATIDQWNTTANPAVMIALRVLYYADQLELIWSLDLIEVTALGNRLTTLGASYFENVITGLRTLAPACFSVGTVNPTLESLEYSTEFGAIATGAIVVLSPVTLAPGANVITTNALGTFDITLSRGTSGNITNLLGQVSHSPSDLVYGSNNITCTVAGTLTVVVNLINTQQKLTDTVVGTGFDLTDIATIFGMSRLMFSGLLWFIISIIICAAVYKGARQQAQQGYGDNSSGAAGNITMLVFALCLIGGTLLGLLDNRVTAFLAIAYAALVGYVLFFKSSGGDIGKVVMFMAWMWFITCLMGGLMVGSIPQASAVLTADITAADTTVTVNSTAGFKEPSFIVIGDERIAYYHLTANTFGGTAWKPLIRGSQDTTAVAHLAGASVRSVEEALLNDSLNYNIALLSDASGIMSFVALPIVVWDILTSFIFIPLGFLGTDMAIFTYIWGIFGLGLLISVFIAMSGGRRV